MEHIINAENHRKKNHRKKNHGKKNHHPQPQNHRQQQTEIVRSTLPPKDLRTKHIDAYKKPSKPAPFNYDELNLTMERFLEDSYTRSYYKKCGLNYDKFNKHYLSSFLQLDYAYNWLSDQLETMQFEPTQLCKILNAIYGSTAFGAKPNVKAEWVKTDENYWTWKYVKMIATIAAKEWDDYLQDWEPHSTEQLLWGHFKKWFLYTLLGGIFVHRAKRIKNKFEFSQYEAPSTAKRPYYPQYPITRVNKALDIMHEWEKKLSQAEEKRSAAPLSTIDERKSNDDFKDDNFKDFNHSAGDNSPSNRASGSEPSMIRMRRRTEGRYGNDYKNQNDNQPPANSRAGSTVSEPSMIMMRRRRTKGGYGDGDDCNNQNDNNYKNNYYYKNNGDYFKGASHSAIVNQPPDNSTAGSTVSEPSMIMPRRRRTKGGYGDGDDCNNQNDNNDKNNYHHQNNGDHFKRSGYDNDHKQAPYIVPSSNVLPIQMSREINKNVEKKATSNTEYDYSSESDDDDDPQDTGNNENDENDETEDNSSDMDLTDIGIVIIEKTI